MWSRFLCWARSTSEPFIGRIAIGCSAAVTYYPQLGKTSLHNWLKRAN